MQIIFLDKERTDIEAQIRNALLAAGISEKADVSIVISAPESACEHLREILPDAREVPRDAHGASTWVPPTSGNHCALVFDIDQALPNVRDEKKS